MAKKRNYKNKINSEGHRQISKLFCKFNLTVINEFCIDNLPFDIFIKELNLIVEYYGNRWHYPKHLYSSDYWDKVKKRYVWEKWVADKRKIDFAKKHGYKVEIIWEYQWKKIQNKTRHIEKMINNIKDVDYEN